MPRYKLFEILQIIICRGKIVGWRNENSSHRGVNNENKSYTTSVCENWVFTFFSSKIIFKLSIARHADIYIVRIFNAKKFVIIE